MNVNVTLGPVLQTLRRAAALAATLALCRSRRQALSTLTDLNLSCHISPHPARRCWQDLPEDFSRTRKQVGDRIGWFCDPALSSGTDFADAVCDRVVAKIWHSEQALGGSHEVRSQDLEPGARADHDRGEEGDSVDEDDHAPKPPIGQDSDILEFVALLDETDGLPEAPAREIGRDHPPERFPVPLSLDIDKPYQMLIAESFDRDEL